MKSQRELIKKLKARLEKEHGRTITEEEVIKSHWFLQELGRALNDGSRIEYFHRKNLEKNPKGFHIKGNFTCLVCGVPAVNENSWYDKNGVKCMPCQKALDE